MTNDLKNHLKSNPQIETVYFNEDNEWQFHKRKGFNKEVSRAEVLKMKVAAEAPADVKKAEVTAPAPSAEDFAKTLEALKAQIKAELQEEAEAAKAKETEAAEKLKKEAEDAEKAKTQTK